MTENFYLFTTRLSVLVYFLRVCIAFTIYIHIYIHTHIHKYGASQVAQWLRIRLPMQEMQVQSLGQENPLEKERATHSSVLAWEIPWTEELGGLQPQRVGKDLACMHTLHMHVFVCLE